MINNKYTMEIVFKVNNGDKKRIEFEASVENEYMNIIFNKSKINLGEKVNVKLEVKKDITLISADMKFSYDYKEYSKIFSNGYESWTDSREFFKNESIRGISKLVPKSIIEKNALDIYGDYTFKEYMRKNGNIHGFTYSYIRNNEDYYLIGSLTERNGYTIINHDTNKNIITIEKDCEGVSLNNTYNIFDMVFLNGKEDDVFDEYFENMNIQKVRVDKMNGYTSWYNHYQNISEDIILDNLNSIYNSDMKLDIFQIDDGFQTAVGDWLSIDKNKFPNGMKKTCDEIRSKGMIPGLWLAPFACEFKSDIAKNHPEWLLKKKDGSFYSGGCNWGGFYILDVCNKEVRDYIKNVFDVVINEWGFELLKLDFLYATAIIPRDNKSRGQIMCEAMDFLRECAGDKLILGCGVPLGPAFGKVDFCRIGCDIGLDYDDKWYMRLLHRERVSTKNALINTIGRRHLNGRAFLNDPDVFLLRDNNIQLNDNQKKCLAYVNHIFGSLLFTSDNIKDYNCEQKEIFNYSVSKGNIDIISVEQDKDLKTHIKYIEEGIEKTLVVKLKDGTIEE